MTRVTPERASGSQPARFEPVRWGILSTARINDVVASANAGSSTTSFVALASRDRKRAVDRARELHIPRAYGSYEELLADPDIEAVYISLPNSMHIEWSLRALESGKHVLCEKPLGADPERVSELFAIARDVDRVLGEAFMYRHHPQTKRAREMVAAGVIGTVRQVNATLSFTMAAGHADPRLSPDLGGGALMDLGCYCVNGLRLFAGEPCGVFAHAEDDGAEVDMRLSGLMWFEGGAIGQFDTGMNLPRRDGLEIVGPKGSIFLSDPWHCRMSTLELRYPGPPDSSVRGNVEHIPVDPDERFALAGVVADAYRLEFDAFSKRIRARVDLEADREDALQQSIVLKALSASANNGSIESVPTAGGQ